MDRNDRPLLEYFRLQLGSLGKVVVSNPRKKGYRGYNDYVPGQSRAAAGALVFLFGDLVNVDCKRRGIQAVSQFTLGQPLPDNPLDSYHPGGKELAYSLGFWLGDGSAVLTLRLSTKQIAALRLTIANAHHTDILTHQLHFQAGYFVHKKSYLENGQPSAEWRLGSEEAVHFFARYAKNFEPFGHSHKSLTRVFSLEKLFRLNAQRASQGKDSVLYDDWRRLLIIWDPKPPAGKPSAERLARSFFGYVQGLKAELVTEGKALPSPAKPLAPETRSFAEGGKAPLCNYFRIHPTKAKKKAVVKKNKLPLLCTIWPPGTYSSVVERPAFNRGALGSMPSTFTGAFSGNESAPFLDRAWATGGSSKCFRVCISLRGFSNLFFSPLSWYLQQN